MRRLVAVFIAGAVLGVGGQALASHVFSDVPDGHTHAGNIQWAAEAGVVQGFADGTFKPDQAVTRGQLATMLANLDARRGPQYVLSADCGSLGMQAADLDGVGSGDASVWYRVDGGDAVDLVGGIPSDGVRTFTAESSGVVTLYVDSIAWASTPTGETCTPVE